MKCSLCNRRRENSSKIAPTLKLPINLSLSSEKNCISEDCVVNVTMRRLDFPHFQIFCIADTPQFWEEMAVFWSELHYNAPGLQYATQLALMGPVTLFTDMSRVMLIKASGLLTPFRDVWKGLRVMLSATADSLGEFSYSPILSDGSSELSMHICSKGCALSLFMQHGLFKWWHRLRWGDRGRI